MRRGAPPARRGRARWSDRAHEARVSVRGRAGRRRFRFSTNAPQREGGRGETRVVEEKRDAPLVKSGDPVFDGLYALANAEVSEGSVESIRNEAFADGRPRECPPGGCFETGEEWSYVWTRDTAYAVDLGLAAMDPTRARNSLEFKLSERRSGGDLQIVQDTGTGGSYPISTDRVVWALGATRLLHFLDGPERDRFAARAFEALRNTVEHDRRVVFDRKDGLYRGETSFLDWREQTYGPWTKKDTVHIGMSKGLSTNVTHLAALEAASRLAGERGAHRLARRYGRWARELKRSIRRGFAVPGTPLLSSFQPTGVDPAPARRYDLLGEALAVLHGVVPEKQAKEIVERYPNLPHGPPVVWPQSKEAPIYHNQALWPFVTAYWLKAAKKVKNDAAVNHAVRSLVRGAGLNLSNMENLDAVSGLPFAEAGERSGPVVNSRRQLWSVAGYLSMVHDVIFGLETGSRGIRFRPYVTREMRHDLFRNTDRIVLDRFRYRGRRVKVVVNLPPRTGERKGAYRVGRMRLDGEQVSRRFLSKKDLKGDSVLEIDLADARDRGDSIKVVDPSDPRRLYGPRTPSMRAAEASRRGVRLRFGVEKENPADLAFNVYRDGRLLAERLPGDTTSWVDESAAPGGPGHWYSVEAVYRGSGNASHRSRPVFYEGTRGDRRRRVEREWDQDTSGLHHLRLVYENRAGPIETGITAGVKRVEVVDAASGKVAASDYVTFPHAEGEARSSVIRARLRAGRRYSVRIAGDRRAINMSAFRHFESYDGAGGREGPHNEVDVKGVELFSVAGR